MSNVDELLLTYAQQDEIARAKKDYQRAYAAGDAAGMAAAHNRAEAVRAAAGYSGGAAGDQYTLLRAASNSAPYQAYADIVNQYASNGMNAIATGYQNTLRELANARSRAEAEAEANQAGARSAVWNTARLAGSGLLTRGLSQTGLADVITATALNQASANAYQALLDRQDDLAALDAQKESARASALERAANFQKDLGDALGNAYLSLYKSDADRAQELELQRMKNSAAQERSAAELEKQEQNYYYQLALQRLKRQWELEDRARGR